MLNDDKRELNPAWMDSFKQNVRQGSILMNEVADDIFAPDEMLGTTLRAKF
jgi:hypothetical protein